MCAYTALALWSNPRAREGEKKRKTTSNGHNTTRGTSYAATEERVSHSEVETRHGNGSFSRRPRGPAYTDEHRARLRVTQDRTEGDDKSRVSVTHDKATPRTGLRPPVPPRLVQQRGGGRLPPASPMNCHRHRLCHRQQVRHQVQGLPGGGTGVAGKREGPASCPLSLGDPASWDPGGPTPRPDRGAQRSLVWRLGAGNPVTSVPRFLCIFQLVTVRVAGKTF